MKKLISLSAMALLLSSAALSQGGAPQGHGGAAAPGEARRGPMVPDPYFFLSQKDVQDDLQLTTKQKDKLAELRTEFLRTANVDGPRTGSAGRGLPPGFEKANMAINEVLTSAQEKRLAQIKIQLQGAMAILNPDLQAELGTTEEQRAQVQKTIREIMDSMMPKDGSRPDRPAISRKIDEAVYALMTPEQRAKLKELGGKPFKRTDPGPTGSGRG